METVLKKLSAKYPDVAEVTSIYNDMLDKCKDCDKVELKDKKYRPFPLLLGILYKAQQAARDPIKEGGVQINDTEDLMHLLGFYWHFIEVVGKTIRDGVTAIPAGEDSRKKLEEKIEINRFEVATKLDIDRSDLVRVWVSEMTSLHTGDEHRLSAHCVDYTIHLDHQHQALVLTIYGTRMFPRPNVHDIVMDLVGRQMRFLHGWAHEGMVTGCRTLLSNSLPHIEEALARFPSYSLLVVGYSLGAALAQLYTMDLIVGNSKLCLPANTGVRAITYGCPPIFTGEYIPEFENILIVNNNHDGISGGSVKNLNEVFIKTGAIERLNLQRRVLIQMLFYGREEKYQDGSELGSMDESLKSVMEEEELEQDGNVSEKSSRLSRVGSATLARVGSASKKALSNLKPKNLVEIDHWNNVEAAIASIPENSDKFLHFRHVSKHILNIKRVEDCVIMKRFSGFEKTRIFSDEMRLHSGMFDKHMPWSYNALFAGFGDRDKAAKVSLQILDHLGDKVDSNTQPQYVEQKQVNRSKSLYPDLSEMQKMLHDLT